MRRLLGTFSGRLALVAVAALAVRVAYTLLAAPDLPEVSDARTYYLLGQNLAEGHCYIRPYDYRESALETPTAEFPPLFPGVLAVADLAGASSPQAQKLAVGLIGTATVVAVGLLGRRVAGERVGLVAAALAAMYPLLFQIDGALMAESLYVPLVTVALLAAYRAARVPDWGPWLVLGGAVGLAALARTEALALLVVLVVPLAWRLDGAPVRTRLLAAGAAFAAAGLMVAPWTIRNAVVLDHLVPISNNGGGLVVGSNCPPVYSGDLKGLWLFSCYARVDVTGMDETERGQAFLRSGLRYAGDHAGEVPGVVAVRFLRTWGLYDPSGQIDWEVLEGRDHTWQTVGHRMYLVLLPFAALGAVRLRRRRVHLWPLASVVVLVCLTTLASYGNQRFRVAAEPALLVLAAAGALAVGERLRGRGRRRGRAPAPVPSTPHA